MSPRGNGAEGHPMLDLFEDVRPSVGWPPKPRYLMSYAYVDDDQLALCQKYGVDLIMDSGAFTTKNLGREMDYDGYLSWLLEHADDVTFALSLDVIGDHEESRVNHQHALDVVGDAVKMVPTFHFGSPVPELERLCEAHDLVCIGGGAGYVKSPQLVTATLGEYHRIAARHGTRLHGLGMTGNRILLGHPWYSVDSTSWLTATRFPLLPLATREGRIYAFEHGQGRLDPVAADLVRHYGMDPDIVGQPGWSLKDTVGADLALERRLWVMKAGARSFMYVEAAKAAYQPDAPTIIYLSGNSGNPGGAVEMVHQAHEMGTPFPEEE